MAEIKSLQPSYAREIPLPPSESECYEGMLTCFGEIIGFLGSIPFCFCCPNPYKTVAQGGVGLISKFGKYYRSVDPGLHKVNLFTEKMQTVSIKLHIEDIPRQYIMTKDNVVDPYVATFLVQSVRKALIERTQTTLRQIFGTRTLQACIEHRDTIAQEIQEIIEEPCKAWGVDIENILIKDLQFSPETMESLSAAATSKRIGESKIIAAQAEVEAAKLMREASDILNTPAAMQIRYLDTLTSMSKASKENVIFMPASMEKASSTKH